MVTDIYRLNRIFSEATRHTPIGSR
jgi:hypothetical protein